MLLVLCGLWTGTNSLCIVRAVLFSAVNLIKAVDRDLLGDVFIVHIGKLLLNIEYERMGEQSRLIA